LVNPLLLDDKENCALDQYEDYLKEKFNLKVDTTQSSVLNTAEVISYFLSYSAYRASRGQKELLLPGINRTSEQFFWIASAQQRCSKDKGHQFTKKAILSTFPHDPFLVINSVRNNENFGKDFGCPIGTAMNLARKC
jgi:Peptidase family M13